MGSVNWTLSNYADDDNKNILGTYDRGSGTHSSSGVAGDITGLSAQRGDVLTISTDTACWIRFGGRTAAIGNGFKLLADETRNFEISFGDSGAISIIDG